MLVAQLAYLRLWNLRSHLGARVQCQGQGGMGTPELDQKWGPMDRALVRAAATGRRSWIIGASVTRQSHLCHGLRDIDFAK